MFTPTAKLFLSLLPATGLLGLAAAAQLSTSAPATATVAVAPPVPIAAPTTGGIALSGSLDRTAVLAGDGTVRMELVIDSDALPHAVSAPTDLIVVLDRSGSMAGDKLLDAQAAAKELVSLLGDEDRFALVSYANDTRVDIPLSAATRAARVEWTRTIDHLQARGGTFMQSGLSTALATLSPNAGRITRTILISDGLPDTTEGLMALARTSATREVPLTTVGIGADYDEALMTALADAGTGHFYWTRRSDDLAAVFASEFATARQTVASALTVDFEPADGVKIADAAGYPVEIHDGLQSFRIGSLVAGQRRSLWVTLQLPTEQRWAGDPGAFTLNWTDPAGVGGQASLRVPDVLVTSDRAAWQASFVPGAWARSIVNEEYTVMQAAVSKEVQAGNCDGALDVIGAYRERNEDLNRAVGSAVVADNLAGLDGLEADVKAQFEGQNQRNKQNIWAKTQNSTAYNGRRQSP